MTNRQRRPYTSATLPNGQTNSHGHPLAPPLPCPCPVNIGLQGFFVPEDLAPQHPPPMPCNTAKRPNQPPRQPPTTPTPTPPMWKLLKSASMSWQRRRMALSASNDVAGTWKHFSAAFSSAPCFSITPLHRHITPFTPEAQEVPKHVGGHKPPSCILSFKAP